MTWTSTWPTEPGSYWAYGYTSEFAMRHSKPELILARVVRTQGEKLITLAPNQFLYASEGGRLVWQPATLPALPEDFGGEP